MRRQKVSNKKVLLVTDSLDLAEEILLHGTNLSKRMDASLEVLYFLSEARDCQRAARSFQAKTAKMGLDVPAHYCQLSADREFGQEAVNYAQSRRNLLCVILCPASAGTHGRSGTRQGKFKEITQLLSCPVVLYTDSPVYL